MVEHIARADSARRVLTSDFENHGETRMVMGARWMRRRLFRSNVFSFFNACGSWELVQVGTGTNGPDSLQLSG